jgi:hypothetical protein
MCDVDARGLSGYPRIDVASQAVTYSSVKHSRLYGSAVTLAPAAGLVR